MPCTYEEPYRPVLIKQYSHIYKMLQEIAGKPVDYTDNMIIKDVIFWSTTDADKHINKLCKQLTLMSPAKIRNCSLELQIWWRDHQIADKLREERERKEMQERKERETILKKLTSREKKILGLSA